MSATIHQIPLRCAGILAITPRPRGGNWLEVDLAALSVGGINVLVSLLEGDEAAELGLGDELACCATQGIEFLSLPVPDLGAPRDPATFITPATDLAQLLRAPKQDVITDNDKKWLAIPGWGCAVLGAMGVIAFLAVRVYAGLGLSPRYALAFDDGGPIFYLCAIYILPLTGIGAMFSWYFKRRAPMIANLAVFGVFLGYGAAGAVF